MEDQLQPDNQSVLFKLMSFFADNITGIIMAIIVVLTLLYSINFLASIFGWGRYKDQPLKSSQVYGIIRHLLVTIINDFRHLLALIITLIFAAVLVYMVVSEQGDKSDALQTVMATIGTLITAILGYYFGESSRKKNEENGSENEGENESDLAEETAPIEEIPIDDITGND